MSGFLRFLGYNNAVPIAVSLMLLGGVSAFAATDPQAIYNTSQKVISVDNTYLVNKDLSTYSPQALIVDVSEDADTYYVSYRLNTIALVDNVWKDAFQEKVLKVDKQQLAGADLGVFATKQIKEVVDYELSRLRATQEIESKHESQKMVATVYGGLVGKFLDEKTETLPGYTPVVQTAPASGDSGASTPASTPGSTAALPAPQTPVSSAASGSLSLQIMGKNPAKIALHSVYADLGVYLSDPPTNDIADLHTFLNGIEVQQVQIDTSTTSVNTIRYAATDSKGNSAEVTRTVEVYDPYAPIVPAPTMPTTPSQGETSTSTQ